MLWDMGQERVGVGAHMASDARVRAQSGTGTHTHTDTQSYFSVLLCLAGREASLALAHPASTHRRVSNVVGQPIVFSSIHCSRVYAHV